MAKETPMVPRVRSWLHPVRQADGFLLACVGVICACLWLFIEVAEEVGEGDHLPLNYGSCGR